MYIKLRPIPFRYTIVPVQFAEKIFLFPLNSLCTFVKNQQNIFSGSISEFSRCACCSCHKEITETLYSLQWGPTKACDQRVMGSDFHAIKTVLAASPAEGTWREQAGDLILAQWLPLVRFPGLGQSLESSRKGWLHWVTWSSGRILWWEQEKGSYHPGSLTLRSLCCLWGEWNSGHSFQWQPR